MTPKRDDVPENVWSALDLDAVLDENFTNEHPDASLHLRMVVENAVRVAAPLIRADEAERQQAKFRGAVEAVRREDPFPF